MTGRTVFGARGLAAGQLWGTSRGAEMDPLNFHVAMRRLRFSYRPQFLHKLFLYPRAAFALLEEGPEQHCGPFQKCYVILCQK
jgi:hypothetical protein